MTTDLTQGSWAALLSACESLLTKSARFMPSLPIDLWEMSLIRQTLSAPSPKWQHDVTFTTDVTLHTPPYFIFLLKHCRCPIHTHKAPLECKPRLCPVCSLLDPTACNSVWHIFHSLPIYWKHYFYHVLYPHLLIGLLGDFLFCSLSISCLFLCQCTTFKITVSLYLYCICA